MLINKSSISRINNIDFKNLSFGNELSDHMFYCYYKNGNWGVPEIKPLENLKLSPSSSVFHYGQVIFEGMKAYKDKKGEVFLFRPKENIKRFNKSAKRLDMPSFPEEFFLKGLYNLINLDREWIPKKYGQSLYIRPFMISNEKKIIASSSSEFIFIIICTPVDMYYSKPLSIKIEEKYSRSTQGGVGYAKAAGNYASSFYPTRLAKRESYDQILWTKSNTHDYIEESGTMNVFFRIGNKLITPILNDRILDGITRKSIIELAIHKNINVEEVELKVIDLVDNLKNKLVKEAFGTGTAVVIHPYKSIGYQGKKFFLPKISNEESFSFCLKKNLMDIQYNVIDDIFNWRFLVKKK